MSTALALFIVLPLAGGGTADIEAHRSEARRQLPRQFARIATAARSLADQATGYDETCGGFTPPRSCATRVGPLRRRALDLRARIDAVEDAGRQGWLLPGEVSALRRQAMDDESWYRTIQLVERWRTAEPPLGTPSTAGSGSGRRRRR
jgi:hypothetical protein